MTLPLWLQIVALVVPAVVAVFSALWATRSARRAQQAEHEAARLRALEDRVAQKTYEMYQPFLQAMGDILTPHRSAAALKKFEDVMADFQTFVIVWGSDEAIEKFFRYRLAANSSPPVSITMRLMAEFLLAVRKDIAWPNTRVSAFHTIAMRINDLPEHPELAEAMSMPLADLCRREGWEAPFDTSEGSLDRTSL
ncbi:hypothetical protein CLV49_3289 [Labedella gwakjiensis]|uniref:Uncharacterized protein n=1 Tax=Labedella gwakjiensis TaxID=390269 RepID=A0A2P8H083_9MICO|nr:hypothetical protein [Labedella gwakjiensis]PSL39645.1 hypothetical protein CLV49_3289 [Labedella gwakjiensis]RUQ85965.1 hypothetical protein ELQ93_02810 [Labedella gwakjiensis]